MKSTVANIQPGTGRPNTTTPDQSFMRRPLAYAWGRLGLDELPEAMPHELRQWLGSWLCVDALMLQALPTFASRQHLPINLAVRSAAHDEHAARLLGPELLVVLLALDRRPFELRAKWPDWRTLDGLLAVADLFGRPFAK